MHVCQTRARSTSVYIDVERDAHFFQYDVRLNNTNTSRTNGVKMNFSRQFLLEEFDLNIVDNLSLLSNNNKERNNISAVAADLSWYRHNFYAGAALLITYGFVFIVGLIGNVLVIIAVFSKGNRTMHHSISNIFLANLAVADLLVIIACLPFTLVTHLVTRKHKPNPVFTFILK